MAVEWDRSPFFASRSLWYNLWFVLFFFFFFFSCKSEWNTPFDRMLAPFLFSQEGSEFLKAHLTSSILLACRSICCFRDVCIVKTTSLLLEGEGCFWSSRLRGSVYPPLPHFTLDKLHGSSRGGVLGQYSELRKQPLIWVPHPTLSFVLYHLSSDCISFALSHPAGTFKEEFV